MGVLASGLEIFFNNPFRVLGVPVDATAKAIEKSFSRAKAQASIEREIEFDSDIPLAVEPERTMESLQMARGKIEQAEGRLQHSLWWFWEGSTADEMAFAALQAGDSDGAVDIWTRVADGKPVSDSNYSSVRNLGLYYLNESVATGVVRVGELQKGLDFLGTFIGSSEHFDKYAKLALGNSKVVVDLKKLMQSFGENVALLLDEALSRKDISVMNLGRYFEVFGSTIGDELAGKFIVPLERGIEEAVSQVSEELKDSPEEGLKLGCDLIETTEDSLRKLGVLLEDEDLEFKLEIIQRKVVEAVRHCSEAYFRHSTEVDTFENSGPDCLELASRALQICSSESVVRKLEAHIEYLEYWIKTGLHPKLIPEVQAIMEACGHSRPDRMEEIESLNYDAMARRLAEICLPRLKKIDQALGESEKRQYYKWLSDYVAFGIVHICEGYLSAGGDPSRVQSTLDSVGQLYMDSITRGGYSELLKRIRGS